MPKHKVKSVRKERALNEKQKKEVQKIVRGNIELKHNSIFLAISNATNLGTITQMTQIAQGTTDTQRNGDSYLLSKRAVIRPTFINSNTLTWDTIRFIVFQWKPNTTPIKTDILLTGASGIVDFTSLYNWDNRNLFSILLDKTIKTVGTAMVANSPGTANTSISKVWHFNIKNRRTQMVAGSATIGTNQIYSFAVSDAVATYPAFFYTSRMTFTDG